MNLLDLDARWRRFNDNTLAGRWHAEGAAGVYDIGFDQPDSWPHDAPAEGAEVQVGEDRLSPDLCRCGDDRFLRCVLPLAIRGSDEVFFFGPWVNVRPETFYAYIDFATGATDAFEGGEAWLMNDLPGFECDEPIACSLKTGDYGERPLLVVADGPLAEAQTIGISFDQLLDIYAASGTDIRPHLNAD